METVIDKNDTRKQVKQPTLFDFCTDEQLEGNVIEASEPAAIYIFNDEDID